MPEQLFEEAFPSNQLNPVLHWQNPPATWSIEQGRLLISPNAETDFWQRTHYGFRADNGHFLFCETIRNFTVTGSFVSYPAHQYDQTGLLVRLSEECWVKTSVESEIGIPNQLGAVVTNGGYSDWSVQDFPYGEPLRYWLRIIRRDQDITVEHAPGGEGPWHLLRLAHLELPRGSAVKAGVYACSPKAAGFKAEIHAFTVEVE